MPDAAAIHLGMNAAELGAAMELVLPLWRNTLSNAAPQSELWRYGISGDLPIICCDGGAVETEKLLRRFCLLKSCGLDAELVYLTREQGEYLQPLLRHIGQVLAPVGLEALIGTPGGVFTAPLEAAETVKSRAAVVIGEAQKQYHPLHGPELSARRAADCVPKHSWDNTKFTFEVNDTLPARIWQHIITNGSLGAIAADIGPAGLWYKNAREMPLIAPPGDIYDVRSPERLYVMYGGRPVSLFAANDGFICRVSFAPGCAEWEKEIGKNRIRTRLFIPQGLDARVLLIDGADGLPLIWELKPALGGKDGACLRIEEEPGIIRLSSLDSYYPGQQMLIGSGAELDAETDFSPAALRIKVNAGAETVLCCGCCTETELRELCAPDTACSLLNAVSARWARLLGAFSMRCGDGALEHYMNGWAVYQTIACRLEGRSSIYQSGGALGFRDQLQDSINLLLINRSYARERILDCCRHQYAEGDVLHWWHPHPDGDRGVRTRCSDDLLWLVWALCEYVEATGEEELCSIEEPYIFSPPLKDDEHDRYERPEKSAKSAAVLEHARAALECCISRGFGKHGLPYTGSGDWNDALDKVSGESVWLGWFFAHCAAHFAELLERLGIDGAERYRQYAAEVGSAADAAFNGKWYLRALYADGEALGGGERIDSVAQSWAVLSGFGSETRAASAMDSALFRLWDREHRLIRLLDPPYSDRESSPGYITGYGEGFRENGGQYTHGAVWLAMSCYVSGLPDSGRQLLEMILPENLDPARYQAEPFVLAADVYSATGHEGEAGWSWYTGSAGWYLRAAAECMLGLRLRRGRLYIDPPANAPRCRIRWVDFRGAAHDIEYTGRGVLTDGKPYDGGGIG